MVHNVFALDRLQHTYPKMPISPMTSNSMLKTPSTTTLIMR